MLIFLIGMPGAGKSTLGKDVAKKLGWGFLDLDEYIEKTEKLSIRDIFDTYGEDHFREIEKEKLHSLLNLSGDLVISCGGGTPCFFDNMRLMNDTGITIFLDVSVETIMTRLQHNTDRPLLDFNPADKLNDLYKNRLSFYRQAAIHLSEKAINADRLLLLLRKYL